MTSHTPNVLLYFSQINELKKTKPFCNDPELIRLVASCLQVNSVDRPTAKDALKMLH